MDPEARHGHKTRTRKRDGYKAHVATEPVTGLVTAVSLTPANTPDADAIDELVAEEPPTEIVADSAYASGAALETFDDLNHTPVVKPVVRKPRIKDGFHRDDFEIDTKTRTVTCPAGHTARIRPGGTAPFAKRCNSCPLRARCTTSERGRTITVDQYHDLRAANKTRWAEDETQNTYRNYRPSVERTIAWLTRHKARRVPYRGTKRNQQWLTTRTAAINLRRLINLGLAHTTTGWASTPAKPPNPATEPQTPGPEPPAGPHQPKHHPQTRATPAPRTAIGLQTAPTPPPTPPLNQHTPRWLVTRF